jgi:hypothetical protein
MPYQEKVLIGEEGQPLITDFALAKARYPNHSYIYYLPATSCSLKET